jgi:phage-related minor tail protein
MQNHYFRVAARAGLLALLCTGLAACAAFKHKDDQPVVTQTKSKPVDASPVTPPAPAPEPPPPRTTATELQTLIQDHKVQELRTTYNGKYGASLLFKPDDLTYYVALFQQKTFWRIAKTRNRSNAEKTYDKFVRESERLAQADLRSITLQAQVDHTEKQVNERLDKINQLQNDLAAQRQQADVIAQQQDQARQEAAQLAKQQTDARRRLNALQRQIEQLQEEQATLSTKAGK